MAICHMKAHKAINMTSVPFLTMHMLLYPHGDRSCESTYRYQCDICTIADYTYVLISTW